MRMPSHHMAEHHTAGSEIPQSHCLKQWIWPRTGLCGGCGRRTALHNLELHARNDDDDINSVLSSSSKHHWQWALHLTPTDYSHILRRKTHIKATRINISNLQQAKHFWGPTSLVFSSTRTMLFFVIPSSRGTSLFFPFIFSYSTKMYTICLSTACQNNTII